MNKTSLLLVFLMFSTYASAQNAFPDNGKVGIGKTNPEATLDIQSLLNDVQLRLRPSHGGLSNSSLPYY